MYRLFSNDSPVEVFVPYGPVQRGGAHAPWKDNLSGPVLKISARVPRRSAVGGRAILEPRWPLFFEGSCVWSQAQNYFRRIQ